MTIEIVSLIEAKAAEASRVAYTADANGDTLGLVNGNPALADYTMVKQFNDKTDSRVTWAPLDTQVAVYRANDDSGIIISFRGTENGEDVQQDTDLGWSQWQANQALIMADINAQIATFSGFIGGAAAGARRHGSVG